MAKRKERGDGDGQDEQAKRRGPEQILDLTPILDSASLRHGSYLAFGTGNSLVFVGAAQGGGGYVVADIDGNEVRPRDGIFRRAQVREILRTLEADRFVETRNNITQGHRINVSRILRRTRTLAEVQLEAAPPFEEKPKKRKEHDEPEGQGGTQRARTDQGPGPPDEPGEPAGAAAEGAGGQAIEDAQEPAGAGIGQEEAETPGNASGLAGTTPSEPPPKGNEGGKQQEPAPPGAGPDPVTETAAENTDESSVTEAKAMGDAEGGKSLLQELERARDKLYQKVHLSDEERGMSLKDIKDAIGFVEDRLAKERESIRLSKMPDGAKKAAEEEAAAIEAAAKRRVQQLEDQLRQQQENMNSAQAKLSEGQVGDVPPKNDTTGAGADVAMTHVVGPSASAPTKPGDEAHNDQVTKDTAKPVDMDLEDPEGVLSGAEREGGQDSFEAGFNKGTTSANLQAPKGMKLVTKGELEREKREAKATAAAQKKAADKAFEEGMAPEQPDSTANMTDAPPGGKIEHTTMEDVEKAVSEARDLAERLKAVAPGKTAEEALANRKAILERHVRAEMLELARAANVQRMQPPSNEELLKQAAQETVRNMAGEGKIGRIPIFAPSEALVAVTQIQQRGEIGQMTLMEKQQLLEVMKPWWNEFRLLRTNQAVMEMEAMPTYIITSVTGDVQLASKQRGDMTEREEAFFYFAFWALRSKLADADGTVPWTDFFKMAAAMGYNDLTQAQVNWLVTGSPDGNIELDEVDLTSISFKEEAINERARVGQLEFKDQVKVDMSNLALKYTVEPKTVPPNRSTSPSAGAGAAPRRYRIVDGKLRELVDTAPTLEEAGRRTLAGIPNAVSNIPDPRFSERGGQMVENVRLVTRRNPNFKPDKPPGPDNPKYIHAPEKPGDHDPDDPDKDPFDQVAVPDVGAGAKEVQQQVIQAEADRLAASLPFKLYAPIHPQACDRYLGEKNYARLALDPEQYMKSFSQHPFGPADKQAQYNWNAFVMGAYGPMLYAFVTDAAMQRSTPVFELDTPDAVTLEYMELNELVNELKAYQMKSADRASRVGDSAAAQTPIEQHLDNFFRDRDRTEQERLHDANAVVISLPDNVPIAPRPGEGGGGGGGDDPPLPPSPGPPTSFGADSRQAAARSAAERAAMMGKLSATGRVVPYSESSINTGELERPLTVPPQDIDHGVRRLAPTERNLMYNRAPGAHASVNDPWRQNNDLDHRSKMFRLFSGARR